MEEGLFRIRRKTLVPAIYRIYLHPDDFEPFRDVVPFISSEIKGALDEKMAALNRSPRKIASSLLNKIGRKAPAPAEPGSYVRASDAWTVEIYPDLDEKLQHGEIEVHSELGSPQKTEYGAGSMTRRIIPQRADSTPDIQTMVETAPPPATSETKGLVFAYLRYADQEGSKTFEVNKNQIVIGRGGRSYWVDLKLETLPDVSREHCRIRRDGETGRFSIEDVSQFGTAVNGKPVGRNASAELPRRATISLAGVIDLQWEVV
jgi:hypothetical protein